MNRQRTKDPDQKSKRKIQHVLAEYKGREVEREVKAVERGQL